MMTLQEAIGTILPGGTVLHGDIEDGVFEVRNLHGYTSPQNCEVLASGVFQYAIGERSRRTYLVRLDERTLVVRIHADADNHLCALVMERTHAGGKRARLH